MGTLPGNSIVEKAKSFAKVLASSAEFQEFYSADEKLRQDQEAHSLLEKFEKEQRKVQEELKKGGDFSGDAIDEIQKLQRKLQDNSTIMEWSLAQQGAIILIQEANQVISEAAGFDFGQGPSSRGPC